MYPHRNRLLRAANARRRRNCAGDRSPGSCRRVLPCRHAHLRPRPRPAVRAHGRAAQQHRAHRPAGVRPPRLRTRVRGRVPLQPERTRADPAGGAGAGLRPDLVGVRLDDAAHRGLVRPRSRHAAAGLGRTGRCDRRDGHAHRVAALRARGRPGRRTRRGPLTGADPAGPLLVDRLRPRPGHGPRHAGRGGRGGALHLAALSAALRGVRVRAGDQAAGAGLRCAGGDDGSVPRLGRREGEAGANTLAGRRAGTVARGRCDAGDRRRDLRPGESGRGNEPARLLRGQRRLLPGARVRLLDRRCCWARSSARS